ncbi:MAG: type II secretion system GspH family protein [Clostridia bacterium]|nr:type II secretion system protein [Clostridiales bacterium]MCR5804854.1 type II secretion system GspH family protein [Clostridia bacterium]
MLKLSKSKKGFTLLEIVTVVAIIAILASVLIFAVKKYIDVTNQAKDKANEKVAAMQGNNHVMSSKIKTYGF